VNTSVVVIVTLVIVTLALAILGGIAAWVVSHMEWP
jgi:hypothetical protein